MTEITLKRRFTTLEALLGDAHRTLGEMGGELDLLRFSLEHPRDPDWHVTTFEAPLGTNDSKAGIFSMEIPTEHGLLEIMLEVPEGVILPSQVKIHRRFKAKP